ncbi:HD domain-containing protein [Bacillus timonensis]|nr:HD domain-containing protein [Bacillus timonensis]
MFFENQGITVQKRGQAIEKINSNSLELSLKASFDGTEVIHHHLKAEAQWVIGPADGWNALEFIYILSGSMTCQLSDQKITLFSGDSLQAIPIKQDCFFYANTDTSFLYITSQPVFHHYSGIMQTMKELAISVEEKDGYTADHCFRIMELSVAVGEVLNLTSHELYQLNLGSFLHDIGKVKVPDHILNKPGKLTDEEMAIMKQHPVYGREIIEETNFPNLLEAVTIVEQHHERYDGSGYPFGLKHDEISIGALIVAVVDTYDAMTTDRIYRKGLTKEVALSEIINGKSTSFHPDVVDAFLKIIHTFD